MNCKLKSLKNNTKDIYNLSFKVIVYEYIVNVLYNFYLFIGPINKDDMASNKKLFPRSVQSSSVRRFLENRLPRERNNFPQRYEYNRGAHIKRLQNLHNEFNWYRINVSDVFFLQ